MAWDDSIFRVCHGVLPCALSVRCPVSFRVTEKVTALSASGLGDRLEPLGADGDYGGDDVGDTAAGPTGVSIVDDLRRSIVDLRASMEDVRAMG